MIVTTNNIISILRFEETNGKKDYTGNIATGVPVFIQPLSEDVLVGNEGMSSFEGFRLMCDYTNIIVGDKITDQNAVEYKVKGVKVYDSMVGEHLEAIIQAEYD